MHCWQKTALLETRSEGSEFHSRGTRFLLYLSCVSPCCISFNWFIHFLLNPCEILPYDSSGLLLDILLHHKCVCYYNSDLQLFHNVGTVIYDNILQYNEQYYERYYEQYYYDIMNNVLFIISLSHSVSGAKS